MLLRPQDSFVCYSCPGDDSFEFVQGTISNISLDKLPTNPGFLISRFDNNNDAYFIAIESRHTNPVFEYSSVSETSPINLEKADYIKICASYIEKCNTELEKIILSRIRSFSSTVPANEIFHELRKAYPSAFVYLANSPAFGTWIGATPEVLLTRNQTKFSTMALAGTLSANKQTQWKQKEKQEQKLVSDFILNELGQLEIETVSIGPYTTRAGNVVHLCTRFEFETDVQRELIIKSLHPTPAICGLPQGLSKRRVLASEPHDRELYSGFLGPINHREGDELYVNLRCLRSDKNQIHLYAGGGITKDSSPEKEWEETEMKVATILGVVEKM